MRPLLLFIGSLFLFGCRESDAFRPSRIVDGAALQAAFQQAGNNAQLPIKATGSAGSGTGLYSANTEFMFQLSAGDDARRRLMGAVRDELVKFLGERQAMIVGWGNKGARENLKAFIWHYCWGDNAGFIDVRYTTENGEGRVDVVCYEHLRGTRLPPAAKGY